MQSVVGLYVLTSQVDVNHSRVDPLVAQNRLELADSATSSDVIGSKGMTESVRAGFGPGEFGLEEQAPVNPCHTVSAQRSLLTAPDIFLLYQGDQLPRWQTLRQSLPFFAP